jgi:hypothetical protein
VGSAFLEHPCRQPSPAAFDIRHHHLFHCGRRASWIRFEPSLRETLVDSNHRCRASIRTLNGPFWARCKLGFDHKPRFITSVTNLGLLGAAIYRAVLNRPAIETQSPEQGGGCRRLPNFPDSSRFLRHQLISAPLLLPSTAISPPRPLSDSRACFPLGLTLVVRQLPPTPSSRTCPGEAAHIPLHSPRGSAVRRRASAPPLPPLSSSHSSHQLAESQPIPS